MGMEIERRFLVAGEAWKAGAQSEVLRQGYLCIDPDRTVRVRRAGERGFLTVKGRTRGAARVEYEYEIPVAHAERMLENLCLPGIIERILARVSNAKAFVTFDIDAVDPAFAPGTGTPEVGGFTSGEAMQLAAGLSGLNIVGFDVVEVLPEYDPAEITALLAANIVYQFISIIAALNKQKS